MLIFVLDVQGKKKTPAAAKPTGKASAKGKNVNRPATGPQMDIGGPEPVPVPPVEGIKVRKHHMSQRSAGVSRVS